jgi:hypothetical protein
MWASTGSWDKEETIALITLIGARVFAYLIPNSDSDPQPPPPAPGPNPNPAV